eukprot:augustus_masked-scaffold_4-processed-gene-18.5-mRNA-1 protein AED:1.00 eAED:1.00 QI:0/-1/0/0/-1/1/1/0/194
MKSIDTSFSESSTYNNGFKEEESLYLPDRSLVSCPFSEPNKKTLRHRFLRKNKTRATQTIAKNHTFFEVKRFPNLHEFRMEPVVLKEQPDEIKKLSLDVDLLQSLEDIRKGDCEILPLKPSLNTFSKPKTEEERIQIGVNKRRLCSREDVVHMTTSSFDVRNHFAPEDFGKTLKGELFFKKHGVSKRQRLIVLG